MVLSSKGGVCSAVVLAPDVVLTAAHCVAGPAEHRVHFRAEDGSPVLIRLAGTALHPAYVPRRAGRRRGSVDLALVRLAEPLPPRFDAATLSASLPVREASLTIGGYGMQREGDLRSTGVFRTADLAVAAPVGPGRLLISGAGRGGSGACNGDSGGPIAQDAAVIAVVGWAVGPNGRGCGDSTHGTLIGPQRAWLDRTLADWLRAARWN
jgi:hypothetical protein